MKHALIELLVSENPAGLTLRLLDFIARTVAPKGGAALGFRHGKLVSIADRTTSVELLAQAHRVWTTKEQDLRAGLTVDAWLCTVTPLFHAGHLVGVLLLEGVLGRDLELAPDVLAVLAAAVAAPQHARPQVGAPEVDEELTEQDALRERTLRLLEQNEWNIARVARILGTTRRTIYQRLERWGVARVRIPKGRRRRAKLSPEEA